MARYTCSFILAVPIDHLPELLIELLQDCQLNVQYYTGDYILARETLEQVSFLKFVTVEVMIDKSRATANATPLTILVKNQELALQLDNHCRQMFELIKQAIEQSRYWKLIETLAD